MNVLSVRRRIAGKLAAQVDVLEQLWHEIVAATAGLREPAGVLVPIRVAVDRQKRAHPRD
jgi:hypothetical protein